MRTALFLLLLLAAAAIPGSLVPQRSADPNGVTTYFQQNPQLAPVLDKLQLFDVYSSAWFSAIYILLFTSLIGCVLPRVKKHYLAVISAPAATPSSMKRMPAYRAVTSKQKVLQQAEQVLKQQGYRVVADGKSVAAERGYWRETGNLIFHSALVFVLISVGIGGAYSFSGQRVLVEGETFVNNLAGFDSFAPGIAFDEKQLQPFSMTLEKFTAQYDLQNRQNVGTPLDFRADVTTQLRGSSETSSATIRVNEPLEMPGAKVYLTGNGYAPVITIRDGEGNVAFSGPVIFLPQDANMTSLGVIKVPDAKPSQFGVAAFFYPTVAKLKTGAFTSGFPAPVNPLLTMNIYEGDLGLDNGIPSNVFSLATHGLKQLTGGKTGVKSIELEIGQSAVLPKGLGTVSFDGLKRYAALDIDYNPTQVWVLISALLALGGLILSLLVPRRRVWVKQTANGFEVAALARGDDPNLIRVIDEIIEELQSKKATK
ncbi:MAG: cytochrome c biogenesis protein ResB [Micrococcales bacterium]